MVGIVSERHLLHSFSRHATADRADRAVSPHAPLSEQGVASLMTPLSEMITVTPANKVIRCLALMLRHNIRHLPVLASSSLDAAPQLQGILSIRDVLSPLLSPEHATVSSPWGLPFFEQAQAQAAAPPAPQ